MSYGIVEYDNDGKPICEICRKSFNRVICHVRQIHQLSEKEYKLAFGFESIKGICSKESAEKSRERIFANYDKCISNNLLNKGENTRFIKGSKGRTTNMVQEETRLKLKARLKTPQMIEAMRKAGQRVGNSGLGNKIRWNTK